MATTGGSNWTYRSSSDTNPTFSSRLHQPPPASTMFVGGGYHDEMLERQIEQARQQRTGFYRRLADAGRRGGHGSTETQNVTVSDISATTVGGSTRRADLSSGMGRRKLRHSEETSGLETTDNLSASVDSIRGHYDPLVFTDISNAETPKPQTSWRYYTTFDKDTNEWRRNAVPVFKTDESGSGETSSFSRTETGGDSKSSAFDRHCRARGCAGLLQSTTASRPLSGNDSRRARSEEVTTSLHYNGLDGELGIDQYDMGDGDGGPYGGHRTVRPYVDDVMRKILGDSWRRPSDTTSTEEKVIYANTSRTSILDDGTTAAAPPVKVEILEGDDESKFVEKTLAPSGRPWVSVPSLSERILMMSTVAEGDEVEVADGTDDVNSLSDSRRAAVMDWLKGSADGSNGESATVIPFGVGSSTKVRLAPVRSETTVREETKTTVEKIGGDRSSAGFTRSTADSRNVDDGWRQPTSRVEEDRSTQRGGNSSTFGVDRIWNEKSTKKSSHCENDVIWIPVIHVPDPVDSSSVSAADGVNVNGRESSTQQRVLSATSWSKQMTPVNTRSVPGGSDPIKSRSISSSPVIIRPTAMLANSGSSCSSRQSEASPPPAGVTSKDSETFSSSISLHTADRPITGSRGPATIASHDNAESDESITCATGSTSIAQIGSGGRGGGFRSVAVSGTGAWKTNHSTATADDRQQVTANCGKAVGVYRSETCFSVDAVEAPESERCPSSTVPSMSSSIETGSRTWRAPTTMAAGVQQVPVNASSVTSTDWNSTHSTGFQPMSGVSVSSVRHFDLSSADADDGDWVIEKAL